MVFALGQRRAAHLSVDSAEPDLATLAAVPEPWATVERMSDRRVATTWLPKGARGFNPGSGGW